MHLSVNSATQSMTKHSKFHSQSRRVHAAAAAIDIVNTILCHGRNENYIYLSYHNIASHTPYTRSMAADGLKELSVCDIKQIF